MNFCVRCGQEHNDPCWVPFRSDAFWSGAHAIAGMILMGEALRRWPSGRCCVCGFDGSGPHHNSGYDSTLYATPDGTTYCGECADECGADADAIPAAQCMSAAKEKT